MRGCGVLQQEDDCRHGQVLKTAAGNSSAHMLQPPSFQQLPTAATTATTPEAARDSCPPRKPLC